MTIIIVKINSCQEVGHKIDHGPPKIVHFVPLSTATKPIMTALFQYSGSLAWTRQ